MKNSPVSVENWPIAFRVESASSGEDRRLCPENTGCLLTRTRTLAGMQKEAVVECGPDGMAWRLLCDEGPWLNGTDLAPFPLGYFAAGVAACFMSDILAQAVAQNVQLDALNLRIDHFFTMEGSVLKGTMAAGVDPINLAVKAGGEVTEPELAGIVAAALSERSVANRTLGERLQSRFCLSVNGLPVEWPGNASEQLNGAADPAPVFDRLRPADQDEPPQPIIHKDPGTSIPGGGGAVGLQTEQKRSVHIHTEAHLRADGLREIAVQCMTPLGSRFVFLSDEGADMGGRGRAPCGLTYLSAGVAFCFMTQLGRYANIKKMRLLNYRIVQTTSFGSGGARPAPVETAVFLGSEDSAENNLQMVRMGEQTCYLHTAFREPVEVVVSIAGD